MASPLAKGLFHRAIGQSGGSFFAHTLPQLDDAEKAGLQFARALGARSIDELRTKPAREIQFARPPDNKSIELYDSNDAGGIDRATAWPIIDGHVLKERVFETFARRAQNDVPLLTGATADEGSTQPPIPTLAEHKRRAAAEYGDMAQAFLQAFPANSDAEAQQAGRRIIGTRVFNWENWTWAKMQAKTGRAGVYFYHFDHAPPKPIIGDRGDLSRGHRRVSHRLRFPTCSRRSMPRSWPWRDEDRELSDTMAAYWTNFAASGNPNGPGLPAWPRFDPQQPTTLHFSDGIHVGAVPDMATLRILDGLRPADSKGRRSVTAATSHLSNTNSLRGPTGCQRSRALSSPLSNTCWRKGKGYGNARGVNNRRNCSLITLTTDDGVVGVGDAAGPLGVIREYIKLLAPFFAGRSLYDFDIVSTEIRNRLYHFGVQGHFIAALGGINIAVLRRHRKNPGRAGARSDRRQGKRPAARLLRHHRLLHRRSEGRDRGAARRA